MAKINPKNDNLPFLKGDLEIDQVTLERLYANQKTFQEKYQERLRKSKIMAYETYLSKIEALTKAKADSLRKFDTEIEKYQTLVTKLKVEIEKDQPG